MKRIICVSSGLLLFALAVCSAQAQQCAKVEISVDPGQKSICVKPWIVDVYRRADTQEGKPNCIDFNSNYLVQIVFDVKGHFPEKPSGVEADQGRVGKTGPIRENVADGSYKYRIQLTLLDDLIVVDPDYRVRP